MKRKLYSVLIKCGTLLSAFALFAAVTTNSVACTFITCQPKEPEGLAKFLK